MRYITVNCNLELAYSITLFWELIIYYSLVLLVNSTPQITYIVFRCPFTKNLSVLLNPIYCKIEKAQCIVIKIVFNLLVIVLTSHPPPPNPLARPTPPSPPIPIMSNISDFFIKPSEEMQNRVVY